MSSVVELLLERADSIRDGAPVPSPCLSVCRMDAAGGLCEGCLRTLDEITQWSGMRDDARRAVWREIRARALQQAQDDRALPSAHSGRSDAQDDREPQ